MCGKPVSKRKLDLSAYFAIGVGKCQRDKKTPSVKAAQEKSLQKT